MGSWHFPSNYLHFAITNNFSYLKMQTQSHIKEKSFNDTTQIKGQMSASIKGQVHPEYWLLHDWFCMLSHRSKFNTLMGTQHSDSAFSNVYLTFYIGYLPFFAFIFKAKLWFLSCNFYVLYAFIAKAKPSVGTVSTIHNNKFIISHALLNTCFNHSTYLKHMGRLCTI